MSDEIRDVTTIMFSETRSDDAGLAGDEYDDSAPPLWQSIVDLGASVPAEEWDRVPTDLAANLDHYLYGSSGEEE
jgi:hypothetical protein